MQEYRNKCSSFNNDLFNNNLNSTAMCNCGHPIEDAEHYLFVCPRYSEQRLVMFQNNRPFHPLNSYKLMFGIENITSCEDNILFKNVQTYIKSTKRFNS